ncbi:MAG: type II secretion system F family protein, partial [Planctomycetota bacterium]|nr:type II secretion system F family protein [Planctomycetota bacterium]
LAAFIISKNTEQGRRLLDWIKISIPILGPTFRKVIISRSIRTLGTMLKSGVSMVDSITLCADVAGNIHYRDVWLEVLEQVKSGRRICEVLAGNPLFPNVLVQMIASGEETGKLDMVLYKVSVYYDREVETSLKTTTSLIEPIMIGVMGVIVGGIGMALMLPIFSLSRPQ